MSDSWSVPYGRYEEAFRAIHSALSEITAPPVGKRVTKLGFTWSPDGTLTSLEMFDGSERLFILNFQWNPTGTLKEVARVDA